MENKYIQSAAYVVHGLAGYFIDKDLTKLVSEVVTGLHLAGLSAQVNQFGEALKNAQPPQSITDQSSDNGGVTESAE